MEEIQPISSEKIDQEELKEELKIGEEVQEI